MPARWFRQLSTTHFARRRRFPAATLAAIDAAITASEHGHRAEVRCAIETAMPLSRLVRGAGNRERAVELFHQLGVADTVERSGVLLYIQVADRALEIVADQGFAELVTPEEWEAICAAVQVAFRAGCYEAGVLEAVERISRLATRCFPASGSNPDELPNAPVML